MPFPRLSFSWGCTKTFRLFYVCSQISPAILFHYYIYIYIYIYIPEFFKFFLCVSIFYFAYNQRIYLCSYNIKWDVTPCSMEESYRYVTTTCCSHLQGRSRWRVKLQWMIQELTLSNQILQVVDTYLNLVSLTNSFDKIKFYRVLLRYFSVAWNVIKCPWLSGHS